MSARTQARTNVTELVCELTTGERLLTVTIEIDCPLCGQSGITLMGHHLRSIRDALIATIDRHPTLTGQDGAAQVVDRLKFTSAPNRG